MTRFGWQQWKTEIPAQKLRKLENDLSCVVCAAQCLISHITDIPPCVIFKFCRRQAANFKLEKAGLNIVFAPTPRPYCFSLRPKFCEMVKMSVTTKNCLMKKNKQFIKLCHKYIHNINEDILQIYIILQYTYPFRRESFQQQTVLFIKTNAVVLQIIKAHLLTLD